MPRGSSKAALAAAKYYAKNPAITVAALAKKYGIHESTIYRSAWYQALKPVAQ